MLGMKWEGYSDGDGSVPSDGEAGDGHGYRTSDHWTNRGIRFAACGPSLDVNSAL